MATCFKFALLASNSLFLLLLLPLTLITRSTSGETCSPSFCGSSWLSPAIQFPFKLRGDGESERCGYPDPGFEVYCSTKMENQTLIYLPMAGEFEVKSISYYDHKLWINDPDDCLPKRFLLQGTIDPSGTIIIRYLTVIWIYWVKISYT